MNLKIEEQQYYLKMQKEEEDTASVNTSHSRADPPHDYEVLLQNLESEVRNHIRVCISYYLISHRLNSN